MQTVIDVLTLYTKYILIVIIGGFTALSFVTIPMSKRESRRIPLFFQEVLNILFLIVCAMTLANTMSSISYLLLGAMEVVAQLLFTILYRVMYRGADILLFNNVYMLLSVGFVIISRIDFAEAQKQFAIACAGMVLMLILPAFRKNFDSLRKGKYLYAIAGILALGIVLVLGTSTLGANLSFSVGGITFQPSEFVKILFILYLASALSEKLNRRGIFLVAVIGLIHVGILVLSRDLGSGVIYYIVLIVLLFIATSRWRYLFGGILLGGVGAVACYFLFSHIRVRVQAFLDPFSNIQDSGYQIAQSLFAISYGGLFGAGLGKGAPENIPFVESDFIFASICEEFGLIFAACVALLCVSVFLCLIKQSVGYLNRFTQLILVGSGMSFIFQTFLTIGGETKFIPLTGVTLPLVSYGGSSVLSTLIMIGICEVIAILQDEKMDRFRRRYRDEMKQYEQARAYAQRRSRDERAGRQVFGQRGTARGAASSAGRVEDPGRPDYGDAGRRYEAMNPEETRENRGYRDYQEDARYENTDRRGRRAGYGPGDSSAPYTDYDDQQAGGSGLGAGRRQPEGNGYASPQGTRRSADTWRSAGNRMPESENRGGQEGSSRKVRFGRRRSSAPNTGERVDRSTQRADQRPAQGTGTARSTGPDAVGTRQQTGYNPDHPSYMDRDPLEGSDGYDNIGDEDQEFEELTRRYEAEESGKRRKKRRRPRR